MTEFSYNLYINGDDGTRYPVIIGNKIEFNYGKRLVSGIISDTGRNNIEVSEYFELNPDGELEIPEKDIFGEKVRKEWFRVKNITGYREVNIVERIEDGLNLPLVDKSKKAKVIFSFKPMNYLNVIRNGFNSHVDLGMWVNGALEEIKKGLYSMSELRSAVEEGLVERKGHIQVEIEKYRSEVKDSAGEFRQEVTDLSVEAGRKIYSSFSEIDADRERLRKKNNKWKDGIRSDLEKEMDGLEKNIRNLTSGEETTIYGRVRIPAE